MQRYEIQLGLEQTQDLGRVVPHPAGSGHNRLGEHVCSLHALRPSGVVGCVRAVVEEGDGYGTALAEPRRLARSNQRAQPRTQRTDPSSVQRER